jgi:Rnl2 family RNA ligase
MEQHSAYEKMAGNLKKLGLSEAEYVELDKYKWVVTEKVHGANFCFIYESNKLRYAKRKDFLNWEDDFFGFQLVAERYEDRLLALFETLNKAYDASQFIIYGELFGGSYPHPEVKPTDKIHPIQTGIYYTPEIDFYAFDIALKYTDGTDKFYLPYEQCEACFKTVDLIHAKPLFIGKLSEAMNFDLRINTYIPEIFDLPLIEDNIIEGVVIKPYNLPISNNFRNRPIIKIKNPEFEEDKRYGEAKKWSYIPDVTTKTEELSFIIDEMKNYVNRNRLESAISKIGKFDRSNKERTDAIEEEFFRDVLLDFNEACGNITDQLNADQLEWIEKRLKNLIYKFIQTYEQQ